MPAGRRYALRRGARARTAHRPGPAGSRDRVLSLGSSCNASPALPASISRRASRCVTMAASAASAGCAARRVAMAASRWPASNWAWPAAARRALRTRLHAIAAIFDRACLQLVRPDVVHDGLVALRGLDARLLLLLLPPLPAADQGQAEGHAANQADRVVLEPGAYFFALFMLVEQVVDCHAGVVLPVAGARSGARWVD